MRKFRIKPGQTDFRPREIPWIWPAGMCAFQLDFSLLENCLYDWGSDRDSDDWNKLGGVSFNIRNNKINSIMAAWRPNIDAGEFDITIYRHVNGKVFKGDGTANETLLSLKPRGHGRLLIVPFDRGKSCMVSIESVKDGIRPNPISVQFGKRFWVAKRLGTWFGGANNSPGEFGGVASQYMELWTGFKLISKAGKP